MSKKTNPVIYRLGINKIWKTEFFEKKNHELPLYIFKDLEIKSYIERILQNNEILLHDYRQHYNNSTLNLYISYFVTPEFVLTRKDVPKKVIFRNANEQQKTIKKIIQTNPYYFSNSINKKLNNSSISNLKTEGVFDQIFKVLNLFINDRLIININFYCINKNLYFLKPTKKKTFLSLQKFKNTFFFKEGIELLFYIVYNKHSANLLAKFIAFQFKKVKRHKFLLSFIKQALILLLNSNLTRLKGMKITIKGRLNGVPRAKSKIILIGDIPVQSISIKIDYAQTVVHNSNGSYGIKVWLVEK